MTTARNKAADGTKNGRTPGNVQQERFLVGGRPDKKLTAAFAGQVGIFIGQNIQQGPAGPDLVAQFRKQAEGNQ